jgi:hypothetical protein
MHRAAKYRVTRSELETGGIDATQRGAASRGQCAAQFFTGLAPFHAAAPAFSTWVVAAGVAVVDSGLA